MTDPSKKNNTSIWAAAFLLGISLLLLYPVIFTREASFFIKLDNLQQQYAFFQKLSVSLHKGYLPVWDANTYGGRNFAGELLPGLFYPPNLIWCFLFGTAKGIDIWYLDLIVAFHYLICVAGMYRLGRLFGLSPAGAVFSALVFTYTGALSQRSGGQTCVFFGDCLLPWTIFFLTRYYLTCRRKLYLVITGLLAGLQLLAGHIQPFFHTALIGGVLVLVYEYRDRKTWKSMAISVATTGAIIMLCFALITLPQLYYSAQWLSDCYRRMGGGVYIHSGQKVPLQFYTHRYMLEWQNLANLIGQQLAVPIDDDMIYMGILPLTLLTLFAFKNRLLAVAAEHRVLIRTLLWLLLFAAVTAFGYLSFLPYILYWIPLFDTARELGRYVLVVSFSASLLAGMAITYMTPMKVSLLPSKKDCLVYILIGLAINMLYLIAFQSKSIGWEVSIPLLLCPAFLLALYLYKDADLLPGLAILILCIDLFLNTVSFLPSRSFFYPPIYFARTRLIDTLESTYGKYRTAFYIQNDAIHRLNLGDVYNIQTKYGYAATVNTAYFDFTGLREDPASETDDLLNIRYIVSDQKIDTGVIFKDSLQGLILYERNNYYPRAWWKRQLGEPGKAIEAQNAGKITQLEYSDLYQKTAVDCDRTDTLIFSENYYPGWQCYDNGNQVPIYPATIRASPRLFRAIPLSPGHHLIEFRYNKVFHWF